MIELVKLVNLIRLFFSFIFVIFDFFKFVSPGLARVSADFDDKLDRIKGIRKQSSVDFLSVDLIEFCYAHLLVVVS